MAKRVRKTTGTKKTTAKSKTSSGTKKTPSRSKSSSTTKRVPTKKTTTPTKKVTTSKKTTTSKKSSTVKKTTTQSVKNKTYEYVRVSENAKKARFVEMGERVQNGELKWSYYAIDGNVGYHYYRKLK